MSLSSCPKVLLTTVQPQIKAGIQLECVEAVANRDGGVKIDASKEGARLLVKDPYWLVLASEQAAVLNALFFSLSPRLF